MRNKKIKVENLEKNFQRKTVLQNLNLNIFESESLSIIGESGSGKSVLTRCIIGLILEIHQNIKHIHYMVGFFRVIIVDHLQVKRKNLN